VGKRVSKPQINVRVELATMEILEAAIYARRLRGPQELLGPVLEELASGLAAQPGVEEAIRARQVADAHSAGKLKQIDQKRVSKSDST
jgi:hypothetical protein